MGATHTLRATDKSGEAMEATSGALLEADRRMNDPIRKYQIWRKVHFPLKEGQTRSEAPHDVLLREHHTLQSWTHPWYITRWHPGSNLLQL